MVVKVKKLDLPVAVSGRPVTNRGVHLQPFGFHGMWLDNAPYWTELMADMGISWVVLMTEGDSVLEDRQGRTPLQVLLDAGIIPIIRDKQKFPRGFVNFETVERTVDLYGQYGLRPFWQLYNEPFDIREWKNQKVPDYDQAWDIIASRWTEGASRVIDAGAYVGFPDGPCYAENPFERLRPTGALGFFDAGMAFYAPHNYGKGRPLWYPYDAVTRHGAELADDAYKRALDDFQDDPAWFDAPADLLNEQRRTWVDSTRTAMEDDTCWRGWEKIVGWALESLGYVPPLAMTEGGWTPRDRAGTGPVDIRWPHSTPWVVAKKTLHMFDTPSPFFAICPWLLADDDMGGTGWPFDAWHGWAYSEKYGRAKPVIDTLKEVPPKEVEPRVEPVVLDVDGDIRDWAWLREAYGASYQRGAPTLRLIEVHEYEGPAGLDLLVVDGDGLPAKGVEFYYHHPGAPGIDDGEWYGHGTLASTAGDGRLSFPVVGGACTPGTCPGAIWPKGKGDLLAGLGLLAGTRNRHLNGVWQLVSEGAPPLPDHDPGGPPQEPGETPQEPGETPREHDDPKDAPSPEPEPPTEPDGPEEDPGPGEDVDRPIVPDTPAPIIDLRVESLLTLDLRGDTYKLEEVVWMDPVESHGLHHIFIDVVDGEGRRLAGQNIRVAWEDGEAVAPVEEKPGEPWGGNFAMFATLGAYAVSVASPAGTSDSVAGLGLGTPADPGAKHHTSFGLRFVYYPPTEDAPVPDEPGPEPKPEPQSPTEPEEPEEEPVPDEDIDRLVEPDAPPAPSPAPTVDPRIESLLTLDLTGDTYKLEEVIWMDPVESDGLHHIFVDVVDAEGRRLAGEKIRVAWSDGEVTVPVEEKPGEPWGGNFAMFTTLGAYAARIAASSGSSDGVAGLGLGTPADPDIKHHTSFGLRFRKLGS